MTGLNLETFLQLLRVAPGAWASLGVALIILALMTWTSWGSRRALRKCLFLSIAAHFALIFYGGSSPELQRYFRLGAKVKKPDPVIERIKVTAIDDPERSKRDPLMKGKAGNRSGSAWDHAGEALALAEANRSAPRPDKPDTSPAPPPEPPKAPEASLPASSAPEIATPEPAAAVEPTPKTTDPASAAAKAPDPVVDVIAPTEPTPEPASAPTAAPAAAPALAVASSDLRARPRPQPQPRSNPANPLAIPSTAAEPI